MSGDLAGRVVLVTGAASGIGQATAVEVAGRGGSVLGLDRDEPGSRRRPRSSRRRVVRWSAAVGDVGDEDVVAGAVAPRSVRSVGSTAS